MILSLSHSLISYVAFAAFALKRFFPIETINYSVFVCVCIIIIIIFSIIIILMFIIIIIIIDFFALKILTSHSQTIPEEVATEHGAISPPTRWIPRV